MGRIKTQLIKRTTWELYRKHTGAFKADFEENKKILLQYADISCKKLRNSIAGYLARLVKRKQEI